MIRKIFDYIKKKEIDKPQSAKLSPQTTMSSKRSSSQQYKDEMESLSQIATEVGESVLLSDFEESDSDDNDEKADMTLWENAKDFKIPFGKHKGKTLNELVKKKIGRSYLNYLLTWEDLFDTTKTPIETALNTYKAASALRRKKQ
jgi:hypothetical protein